MYNIFCRWVATADINLLQDLGLHGCTYKMHVYALMTAKLHVIRLCMCCAGLYQLR